MLGLIIKDFVIQRKISLYYLLIVIIFMSYFSVYKGGVVLGLIAGCFMITYGFVNRVFYEDEKQNVIKFLLALPIKKQTLVLARYLSIMCVFFLAVFLYLFLHQFLVTIGLISQLSTKVQNLSILLAMIVLGIQIAIYLPMLYQFGYIKASGINRFLLVGFGVVMSLIATLFTKMGNSRPPAWIYGLEKSFAELNPWSIWLLLIMSLLLIYGLSLVLSIKLFERKDIM